MVRGVQQGAHGTERSLNILFIDWNWNLKKKRQRCQQVLWLCIETWPTIHMWELMP